MIAGWGLVGHASSGRGIDWASPPLTARSTALALAWEACEGYLVAAGAGSWTARDEHYESGLLWDGGE